MKVMLLAFVSAALIAVLADVALQRAGLSAQDVASGPDVRVD
ncbi:hypothetical protein DEA8626_03096 [Defluviimonas aquaemixtae]|uniref:Uncharacterized protein n=1 Tax=Albidovulum aquaemixtae TaxID=1542388 RepID=A0A2R8BKX6_9RHOB|nr:hypothetical protein [Defluviimonas aquaemixtae]SPH24048.1 hypothetical protein DEA8626_03096 [Defluviimonas aquaemixtae]